jgi:acetoacetate decarboxylase
MQAGYSMPSISSYFPGPPYQYQDNKGFSITFRTTPEVLRELTPTPLSPNPDNLAFVYVGEFNVVSPAPFTYMEAGIGIPVGFEETFGNFYVYLYLDSAVGIVAGREIWGFPKKDADFFFTEQHDTFHASVIRDGVTLINASIQASNQVEPNPALSKSTGFNLKLIPSARKNSPPDLLQLTTATLTTVLKELFTGEATLTLNSSPADRLGEIPVLEIVHGEQYVQDLTLDYGDVVFDYLSESQ